MVEKLLDLQKDSTRWIYLFGYLVTLASWLFSQSVSQSVSPPDS
jgi:hypothetical protein